MINVPSNIVQCFCLKAQNNENLFISILSIKHRGYKRAYNNEHAIIYYNSNKNLKFNCHLFIRLFITL